MHIYFTVVLFVIGTTIASFLNALLYRIDNGYKYPDIYIKGSHCEKCNKQLKWYELIPILSYVFFRGKCKQCGYKIPIYYPISELFLGISLSSTFYFNLNWSIYILILFLFIFSYYDRIYKGIQKDIVHTFLIFSLVSFVINTAVSGDIQPNSILISLVLCLFIFILTKILKKPFGMGDLLILLGMGFILPPYLYIGFVYIFLFVSLISALVLICLKKGTFKTSLPLLPFMYISFGITILLSEYVEIILESINLI